MKALTERRLRRSGDGNTFALFFTRRSTYLIAVILLISLFLRTNTSAQTITVTPAKPKPGDLLKITCDPGSGQLRQDTTMRCKVYIYQSLMPTVRDIVLIREGSFYKGTIATPTDAQLAALSFSGGKKEDQEPDGFLYPFYDGDKPVEGAMYLKGNIYFADDAQIYHFKKNEEKAIPFFAEESKNYPDGKYTLSTTRNYYQALYNLDSANGERLALAYIDSLNKKKEKTEQDHIRSYYLYQMLNLYDRMQETLDAMAPAYPNSGMFFTKRFRKIQDMTPAIDMEKAALKLIADYKMDSDGPAAVMLPVLDRDISLAYLKELNYPKFYSYLSKLPDPIAQSYTLITGARLLSERSAGLEEAIKMGNGSIHLLDSISQVKPANTTEVQWKKKMDDRYGEYLHTYGYVLYQAGNYAEALITLKRSYALTSGANEEINLHYALALVKNNQPKEALPLLEAIVKSGNNKLVTERAFKDAYLKTGGSAVDYDAKLTSLTEQAKIKNNTVLRKEMISKPAPDFTLKDMNGKIVSLSDYKGKTVVLDFWATWCGPCKEAFPGMQKLINKYSTDKNVVFLFINTSENITKEAVFKNVQQYMNEHHFTFHVVLDERIKNGTKFNVGQLYDATSIPLKIVIDKTGSIRFRSVGYPGSTDLVVDQLSAMIEMIK